MTFRIGRKRTAALIVAVFLGCGAIATAQGKVDVTGNWVLEVMTQAGGTTMPTVTLKQDGEKLTGLFFTNSRRERSQAKAVDASRLLTRLFKSPFQETNMAVDQGHGKPA